MSALGPAPARLTCVGWPPNVGGCGAAPAIPFPVIRWNSYETYPLCRACAERVLADLERETAGVAR